MNRQARRSLGVSGVAAALLFVAVHGEVIERASLAFMFGAIAGNRRRGSSGGGGGGGVAPTLSSPAAVGASATTAALSVASDQGTGTLFWIVCTSGTAPSKTQITAGQDSSGATAAAHGSQTVTAIGTQSATATGLTAGTTYYAYFMHTNASSLQSNVAATTSFAITLSAPSLSYPSPIASNPTTLAVRIPIDWQSGDVFKLVRSASPSMSSPTILAHTITDSDVAAGTFSIGLSGVTLSGNTYFQGYGSHGGVDSSNLSGIVSWGDSTAPTITTSAAQSVYEQVPLAITLTATDTGGVPALVSDGTTPGWRIASGADQLQVQVVIVGGVPTVQWYGNGSQSFASPKDQTLANTYKFNVQAIDYGGNSSTLAMTVTVNAIAVTFSAAFTNVNGASLSTQYTSNSVTVNITPTATPIATSVTGSGFTYSKNGGAYQAAGSFTVVNGDTITLRDTSGSANGVTNTGTLTVGSTSQSWSVATPGLNMLLNSTFADTSAWTLGGGCSISGGVCNASGAGAICQQPVTTWANGGVYQVDLDYTCTAGSKVRLNQNASNGANVRVTSAALTVDGTSHHLTLTFTSNVTSDYLSLEADSATFTGTIDNFTCVRTA